MLFKSINLAIVDDNTLFRKTLQNFLSEQKNFNVSIVATDMVDLFEKIERYPIDVLLMDLCVQLLSGCDAIKAIHRQYPGIKILIISKVNDMETITDLLDFKIHGYISKADGPEDLIKAIMEASENMIYRSKLFTEALYCGRQNNAMSFQDECSIALNEREKRILQLIWQEKSNKEIGIELFIGVRTVEKIRQDLKEKIGAKSTLGLLKYAIHRKIIRVNSPGSLHPEIGQKL